MQTVSARDLHSMKHRDTNLSRGNFRCEKHLSGSFTLVMSGTLPTVIFSHPQCELPCANQPKERFCGSKILLQKQASQDEVWDYYKERILRTNPCRPTGKYRMGINSDQNWGGGVCDRMNKTMNFAVTHQSNKNSGYQKEQLKW